MNHRFTRPFTIAAAVGAAAMLSACGADSASTAEESVSEPTGPLESYAMAGWALEAQPTGEWVGGMENDDLRIDAFQVGVAAAPEDSGWTEGESDEPLFEAGEPVVVVQYIVTTVGDDPVVLSNGEVDTTIRLDGSAQSSVPGESGMARELLADGELGDVGLNVELASSPIDYQHLQDEGHRAEDGWNLELAPEESASWVEAYGYEPGGDYDLNAEAPLVTDDGETRYDTYVISGTVALSLTE